MEQLLQACLILLPFGITLRMSLHLLYGARGPQVGDPIYLVINTASWTLVIMPMIAFVVVGTSWLSWFVLVVTAIAGLEFVLARRAMQRRAVWELITGEVATRKPDVESLQNHQGRFSGIVGRAYRHLVRSLQQGVSLYDAIGENRRALPEEAQAYAAMGAITDRGADNSNSQTSAQRRHDTDMMIYAAGQQLYQRYAYLSTVLVVMITLLTFLLIKIIPSYNAIFQDFDLELPALTIYLIGFGTVFSGTSVAIVVALLLLSLLLVGLIIGVAYLCDVHVLRPLADRMFFSRHRSQILRLLAIAAERGQSFHAVLQRLIDGKLRYPSGVAIDRLRRAHRQIDLGVDWKPALQSASIIKSSDLPMLTTAQHAGNLPWVLRMLAEEKTRSMIFRWKAVEQILFPLMVLLLSFLVLIVCVAMFLPLVELIYSLTG